MLTIWQEKETELANQQAAADKEAALKEAPINQIGEPKVIPGRQLGDISGISGLNLITFRSTDLNLLYIFIGMYLLFFLRCQYAKSDYYMLY